MPGSSKTLDALNQIAASPRKRLNEVGKDDDRPQKRVFTELQSGGDENVAIGTETSRKRARLSRSTLSRPSLDTMGQLRSTARAFEVPPSPERKVATPRPKPKAIKNRHLRPINGKRVTDASPLRDVGYGAIGLNPGANLTSHNSPAKVNRRKATRRPRFEKQQAQEETEATDLDEEQQEEHDQVSNNQMNNRDSSGSARGSGDADHSADRGDSVSGHEEEEEMAAMRTASTNSEQAEDELPNDSALANEIQQQHNARAEQSADRQAKGRSRPRITTSKVNAPVGSEQGQEDDYDDGHKDDGRDTSATNELAPSQRRQQRKKMTEAERQEKRQAEALQRIANTQESEHALADLRQKRGESFVYGIIDVLERAHIGSVGLWSRLGAASTEITELSGSKAQMDTTRAKTLDRTLQSLKTLFSSHLEETNTDTEDFLRKLKIRTSRGFLRPDDDSRQGDPTVNNLFQFLIPKAVRLIRRFLRLHFCESSRHSWAELHVLVKAAHDLCNVALSWTPKPSTMEAGIRGNVYNNIRPNLEEILRYVKDGLRNIEFRESQALARTEADQALTAARRRRDAVLGRIARDLNQRMSSIGLSARPSPSRHRNSRDEVVDINDIADDEPPTQRPVPNSIALSCPTPWTDSEDTILLNGLQKYRGADRFLLIRRSGGSYLQNKTADECVARAMYFKNELARAGRTFDWLEDL